MTAGTERALVRVLVADPSAQARQLLVSQCQRDPLIEVVAEAVDGAQVVEQVKRLRPSLVLLAVDLPVLDGVEATKQIMREQPTPIIIVTAGVDQRAVEQGLNAVRLGALTVLDRPAEPGAPGFEQSAQRLVAMVKALSDVKVIRRRTPERARQAQHPQLRRPPVELVAVAASTGGPPALSRLLQLLPADLPVPVVVVQHIVEGFLPGLVTWLRTEVPFRVTQAVHGQRLEAGTVYLAPDAHHLEVDTRLRARLTGTNPVGGFRPSATVLFDSLARGLGPSTIGVVLTGMGRDGLDGVRALRAAGGRVLAQDQASSVVYGMPAAVTLAGLAHLVGPVDQLAADIAAATKRNQP